MPSFNGVALFGIVQMATASVERERQINAFFGLQGVESIDGGFRRRITTANGLHVCNSAAELAAVQELFRSYEDENAYPLVDTRGVAWSNVVLLGFNPSGKIMRSPSGRALQYYSAQFLHLSPS